MKYVTRIVTGILCALIATASIGVAPAHDARGAIAPDAGAHVVASVNGVAITTAALDDAVRASGRRDSPALRHELKQKLIAWELLRQAATKAQRVSAPGTDSTVPNPDLASCSAHEIGSYLREVVHPAAVTEADIRLRYAQLLRERAAPTATPAATLPGFPALEGRLRERLEAERFEQAVRQLAERLMNEAQIDE